MSTRSRPRWTSAGSGCTAARSAVSLSREESTDAARDQGADVGQDAGKCKAGGCREVSWFPHRIEFLLVAAQSLEVVEVLTMPVQKPADAVPQWRHRANF